MAEGSIKVDIDRLESLAGTLKGLKTEFDGASGVVDAFAGDLGSGDVAGALHSFATDWRIHREKLDGYIETVASRAAMAADAYRRTEDGAARAAASLDGRVAGH